MSAAGNYQVVGKGVEVDLDYAAVVCQARWRPESRERWNA